MKNSQIGTKIVTARLTHWKTEESTPRTSHGLAAQKMGGTQAAFRLNTNPLYRANESGWKNN